MKNIEDYNAKLEEAKALAPEDIKKINMPVGIYVQEAENLYQWAKEDAEQLIAAGITQEMIDSLPTYAGALRQAQSIWVRDMQQRKVAEQQWAEKSPAAFDTRDKMLHAFRYAFRKNTQILANIDIIAEGYNNADMVQDLNDLSILGLANAEPLNKIGVTNEQLQQLAVLSNQMGELLAMANGEKQSGNENKILRDRFYSILKNVVDEIAECGKFVFWRNPNRRKGYSSKYKASQRATAKNHKTKDQTG